jgi:phenylpropionate dioxygenase-like ring-hydroxylating dioxygenase large terminal subunit
MNMTEQPDATSTRAGHNAVHDGTDVKADNSLRDNSTRIDYPASWYYFGSVKEVRRRPLTKTLLGKRLVGFLTESGQPGVLESSCVHMGSDLGGGCVVGESLQCSLHHWQFDRDGHCTEVPASNQIPPFARQCSYPAIVRHGNVYFFNGPEPLFALPFFEGLQPDQLVVARPFIEYLDCPWYMVGANAVDVQHFAIAHDRRMERRPEVDYPHPHAHRTVCHFEVAGNSLADRITKHLGGAKVRLQVTDWSSTMIFARSTLAKTESFGIVSVVPLSPRRAMAHVTVMAHASSGPLRRTILDPLRTRVRRSLIRKFLRSDVHRLSGTRYSPNTLIEIDDQFSEYFDWLKGLHRRGAESREG